MSVAKTLTVVAIAAAFSAGMYFGASQDSPINITASSGGSSYGGGYTKDASEGNASGKSAVIKRTTEGQTHVINQGDLIMDAVKLAKPGDTIQLMPGVYHETVYIDKDDIRIIGVIKKGERATLDGQGKLNDAILYSGNNVVVENLLITNYKGNGIMGQAGNNFEIRNNIIIDTGVYGIFPQLGTNGIVSHNIVSGIEDAAIYVGMSDNIQVSHNEVFNSVAGIEIENSRHAIVENNYVHNNTGGILAFITPGLPIKTTFDVIIRNNFIIDNNHVNFGAPGSMVAGIPSGVAILIMAADEVVIEGNIITGNKTAAVLITDHHNAPNATIDPESDPNPDRIMILDNLMDNNGFDTHELVRAYMLSKFTQGDPDIASIGDGKGSCIINRHRYVTVGIDGWAECDFTNTHAITSYILDEPVAPRVITPEERGEVAYLGVCTGCHSYTGRLIGPPMKTIQAMYMNRPQALADWIANPVKIRADYPEMPPQNYLDDETRLAVANYILQLKK